MVGSQPGRWFCLKCAPARNTGQESGLTMKFLVLVSNGVSRKIAPIFVGTLFEFWGVCFIIDL